MFRALQYVILLVSVVMTAFYVASYQPELVTRAILSVDIYGITKIGKEEITRTERIKSLPISYAEKQVLLNHTVFIQATQEMVKLALGEPKTVYPARSPTENTYFVYYLGTDKLPTVMVFEDDKLTQAYKGSSADNPAHTGNNTASNTSTTSR